MISKDIFIKRTFLCLQEENINYVVLRNFSEIPYECTIENDIDILVEPIQLKLVEQIFRHADFSTHVDNDEYIYGAKPHYHFVNTAFNVHFDIVTGLFYRSLMNRNMHVKVDADLQSTILEHKIEVKHFWKYRPSVEDFLVHLCCHCIFDKQEVNKKNHMQILEAFANSNLSILRKKLNTVFFNFTDKLISLMRTRDIYNLFHNYLTFSKY